MISPAPYCVGIAGGTGSGKTTLARTLCDLLGPDAATVVETDSYYRDLSDLPAKERHLVNFDHPDALDVELMAAHVQKLCRGRSVRMHAYDFTTHCRTNTMVKLQPRPIILIEGIFVLTCEPVVRLLDLKIYIDERADVRRERRMLRDIRERGRTPDMISRQYENHVVPMHERYVEPYKKNADIILCNSNETDRVLPLLRESLTGRSNNSMANHKNIIPAHGDL